MIDFDDFVRLTDVEWRTSVEVERGIFIAEGLLTIQRALAAGCELRTVVSDERWLADLHALGISKERIASVDEVMLEQVTGYHVHRGALAAFQRPPLLDAADVLTTAQRLVVVEDVVDHANIGAIVRSAAAFDIDAILLTPRCADPLYRRAIKVSMGNVFKIRWSRIDWPDGLRRLHEAGFTTLAMTPDAAATDLRDVAADVSGGKWALLLGTEGDGLHPKTIRDAAMRVRIPMSHDVDSLNVAAATAVACYALTR